MDTFVPLIIDGVIKTDNGIMTTLNKALAELRKETPDYFVVGFYFAKVYQFILPQVNNV